MLHLTKEQIIAVAHQTRTAESRDGDYILPISFAEAIIKANDEAAPVSAGTIDTPELQAHLESWRNEPYGTREFENAWSALVAHIDQHVAAAVAEARSQGIRIGKEWGIAEANAERAATAPVSAVPAAQNDQIRRDLKQLKILMDSCEEADQKAFYRVRAAVIGQLHSAATPSAGAPVNGAEPVFDIRPEPVDFTMTGKG